MARGFAQDAADILEYNDESFHLFMEYAPLNQALDEVTRGISVVSPDTLIKPGSTLSNLGNVQAHLLRRVHGTLRKMTG